MKAKVDLNGWNLIIYELILNKFKNNEFSLKDIYKYEKYFKKVYPENNYIKDKIRQTLQNLRNFEMLEFLGNGTYKLSVNVDTNNNVLKEEVEGYVYLLSNEAIPDWVKIGRTINIEQRVKDLYNTSVPLPFKLEDKVLVNSYNDTLTLERSIHNIIDTINPSLRKDTEASRREFFKLNVEEAKRVFDLVRIINTVDIKDVRDSI